MRAAIFNGPGKPVTIERRDDPAPARDQVVVKICRCGICGSDVSMLTSNPFARPAGTGFGHEYAGEVVALGHDVTHIRIGDRVACMPAVGCGHCEVCRSNGNVFYCTTVTQSSVSQGFAEYAAVPAKGAIILPRTLSFTDGALVEPMACGLHACRMARVHGKRILVLGGGAMAVAVISWARALGARRIVALSRSAHRHDVLLAMGADAVHDFESDPQTLHAALGGAPDIVMECVGAEGMLNQAIDQVRPQGTIIAVGVCSQGETVAAGRCALKELRVLFSLGWTSVEFSETVRAFDSGKIRPEIMVSDVISLDSIPAVIESLRTGKKRLKVLADPRIGPTDVQP